jgi:hypothetical protein
VCENGLLRTIFGPKTKEVGGDKLKEDEMSGTCSTDGKMRNVYKF